MSRKVDYEDAADWPKDEVQANYQYLLDRGRELEATWALDLRGEKWDDVFGGVPAPVNEPQPVAPSVDPGKVPEGTIDEVLTWVGNDADRALDALAVEDDGKQRTTLMEALEAIIES
jgi:hypothetical protein